MADSGNDGGTERGAARYGEPLAGALLESPAAERNKEPILDVLRRVLPSDGEVLEVASGTGQHVVHFAAALPALVWQPTDPDPALLETIRRRLEARPLANVRAPARLDVLEAPWPVLRADAVLAINMIHIAPWGATDALFGGASALLPSRAPLILYGPYRRAGTPTAPSNEAFDASLKARNPDWGLRGLEQVVALAERHGFSFDELVEMPANNVIVTFRRLPPS